VFLLEELIQSVFSSIDNLFPGTYFGSTINQYLFFFGILILFAIIGKIVYFVMKNQVRRLTEKTKTELDDILVDIVEEPLVLLILIIGLFVGFQFLTPDSETIKWFFDKLVSSLIVATVAWFAVRLINVLIEHYLIPLTAKTESKLDDQLIPVLSKASKIAVVSLSAIIILNGFGYDVTALIAGLGIGGLAFAFAAQDTIANLFGGIAIFVDKPFTVGDRVQFKGLDAVVKQVGIRTTKLKDFDNQVITVPNSLISKDIVTNVSLAKPRRIKMTLNLVYNTPKKKLLKAKELIFKAVELVDGTDSTQTKVVFNEFSSSSLDLMVIYYLTKTKDYFRIKDEVNFKIMDLFEKEKLEFAYPTQTVYLQK
jgi:MscS family membrane protein